MNTEKDAGLAWFLSDGAIRCVCMLLNNELIEHWESFICKLGITVVNIQTLPRTTGKPVELKSLPTRLELKNMEPA